MKIRTVKKYGNTHAVKLEPADLKDYEIKEGSRLDLESALEKGSIKEKKNG